MLVVLWETAEQAARSPEERGPRDCAALARFAAASTRETAPVWEVNARV